MYTEDDMLLPYDGFIEFTKKMEELKESNYLPGFVRIEERDGGLHNTDNTEIHFVKKEEIIEIKDRRYFIIKNPYQASWILPNDIFKKIIQKAKLKKFLEVKKEYSWFREYTALLPNIEGKMTSIIELDENNKIHKNCYVYHLPNNYFNNSGGFGSIPIDKLICIK